jgi:hypothetical protein
MVRFEDDVAEKLRARAHVERRTLNRIVNDVMRRYLDAVGTFVDDAPMADRAELIAGLTRHIENFKNSLSPLDHQETQQDYNDKVREALHSAADCFAALSIALSPSSIPVIRASSRDEVHA